MKLRNSSRFSFLSAAAVGSLLLLQYPCSLFTPRETIVAIQPLGDFPKDAAVTALNDLRKIIPNVVLQQNLPLPSTAFYPARNRYRADALLKFLHTIQSGDTVVAGLTVKDISTGKNEIKDWGIMGLANCPGRASIVSNYRLAAKNKSAQFFKVLIHELGHTQGLPHCPNKGCFMQDARGGNILDTETDFCPSCKAYLKKRGWRLH